MVLEIPNYYNHNLARIELIPKAIRIYFGKQEMKRRSLTNYQDRIEFLKWAFPNSLPDYKPKVKKTLPENIIWQYWDQGLTSAPELIRVCVQSVRMYTKKHKHIVLSDENIFDFIDLPDYIIDKWTLINPPKKSNIIRLALLQQYGGVWIDSTCILTAEIPDKYFNYDFFVFSNSASDRMLRNWFMCAKKENPIIHSLLKMHYKFYSHHTNPRCYFFFHYMFENLVTMDKNLRKIWVRVDKDNADFENNALKKALSSLTLPDIKEVLKQSWIHKLDSIKTSTHIQNLKKLQPTIANDSSHNHIVISEGSRSSFAYGKNYLSELDRIINSYSIKSERNILEWGMGNSTKYFLENRKNLFIREIYSIDHVEEYFKELTLNLPKWENFHPYHIDLMGTKKSDRDQGFNYSSFPLSLGKKFDVIYIDGRRRVECAFIGAQVCHKESTVILHDYRRERYQSILSIYDIIEDGLQFRVMKVKDSFLSMLSIEENKKNYSENGGTKIHN